MSLRLPACDYVVLDEFLTFEEWQRVLAFTLKSESKFTPSMVLRSDGSSSLDAGYRRSRILFDLGPMERLFSERLMSVLPYVLWRLWRQTFSVSHLEIQLTATNHSEFFRPHTDNGSEGVDTRLITFVYYFHREPRRFSGGELRIVQGTGAYSNLVFPIQNQAVFFCSETLHEVLPVFCPTGDFANSRFTVNGWYHS